MEINGIYYVVSKIRAVSDIEPTYYNPCTKGGFIFKIDIEETVYEALFPTREGAEDARQELISAIEAHYYNGIKGTMGEGEHWSR